MVELLKQPQYKPYHVNDQVVSIFAGARGFLDNLPINRVAEFEQTLLQRMHDEHPEVFKELEEKKDIDKELEQKLLQIVATSKDRFVAASKK
jgi:F-type H+-transporting ATPase subunit alpha